MAAHIFSPRIVTFGESMAMLRSGGVGRLAQARAVQLSVGGAESNVAIGTHRLGIPSLWVSRVGADPFGEVIEGTIRGSGVGVLIDVDSIHRSGFAVREQRTTDRTRMTYYRAESAAATTRVDLLPAGTLEAIAAADIFHVSGISLAVGPALRKTVFELVRHAQASQTLVSFDVNHRTTMWADAEARACYRHLLQHVDVCFAGDDEARLVTSGDTSGTAATASGLHSAASNAAHSELHALAAGIASLGPSEVIIKLGAHGAFSLADGNICVQAAASVTVVDSVGAGDAFVAGYLSAIADGLPPSERLDRGIKCGAIACASEGDWEGNPTRAELDALLDGGDPVLR